MVAADEGHAVWVADFEAEEEEERFERVEAAVYEVAWFVLVEHSWDVINEARAYQERGNWYRVHHHQLEIVPLSHGIDHVYRRISRLSRQLT